MKEKVIVIVGPTAVGKTKLGIELAKKLDGEIISGDSMQIYRGMDIGTAKVTHQQMQGIKHHLLDIRNFDETFSVMEFQYEVRKCIQDISCRNKVPIIVGGTGLYIKAALYDYEFSKENKANDTKFEQLTNEQLYHELCKIDYDTAMQIHPNNRRRVIRAIEIFYQNGKTKSEIINSQKHECLYDAIFIGLTLPREILYQRINERVEIMFQSGLIHEFNQLIEQGANSSMQSMKAIGYKELFELQNDNEDQIIKSIQQHSRQYAKRQYTWFKNQMDIHFITVDYICFENTVKKAFHYIQHYLFYQHCSFVYHDENLDFLLEMEGIDSIKIGYSEGDKNNPSIKEIKSSKYHHYYLVDIYYDSSILPTTILHHQLEHVLSCVQWMTKGKDYHKFYELSVLK